jgi:hypothetical protein
VCAQPGKITHPPYHIEATAEIDKRHVRVTQWNFLRVFAALDPSSMK